MMIWKAFAPTHLYLRQIIVGLLEQGGLTTSQIAGIGLDISGVSQ
jgi:hypothetical protein